MNTLNMKQNIFFSHKSQVTNHKSLQQSGHSLRHSCLAILMAMCILSSSAFAVINNPTDPGSGGATGIIYVNLNNNTFDQNSSTSVPYTYTIKADVEGLTFQRQILNPDGSVKYNWSNWSFDSTYLSGGYQYYTRSGTLTPDVSYAGWTPGRYALVYQAYFNGTPIGLPKTVYCYISKTDITSPSSGTYNRYDTVTLSGTMSGTTVNSSGYPQWKWYVNGLNVATGQTANVIPYLVSVTDGAKTVELRYYYNSSSYLKDTVSVTMVSPSLSITAPTASTINSYSATTFTGSISNPPTPASYYPQWKWYVDNVYKGTGSGSTGSFTRKLKDLGITSGSHSIMLRYYYNSSHYKYKTKTVTVVSPTVSILHPTATIHLKNSAITLTGSYTNKPSCPSGYPKWKWYVDGTYRKYGSNTSINLGSLGYGTGNHTLQLRYYVDSSTYE